MEQRVRPCSPPLMCPLDLRDCIEELLKFTLQSSVNQTLEFDLGLSTIFCSNLLLHDPQDPTAPSSSSGNLSLSNFRLVPEKNAGKSTESKSSFQVLADSFYGVPPYPLYKRLASALYQSIISGIFFRAYHDTVFVNEDSSLNLMQKETEWKQLILDKGSYLVDILNTTACELQVEEPFFSQLKDGRKTVEGRCAIDEYNRIKPDALILLNKCVMVEVQDINKYDSFSEMLEVENLEKVFPEVDTVEEGLQIYRGFYTEENERANGVVAICVSKVTAQPHIILASILAGLSYGGVQSLLGLAHTVGSILEALPPPRSALLSSFELPYKPNVKGSTLSHGARALAKHANRCSDRNWGNCDGGDSNKNRHATDVVNGLIASCCWLNVHIVPSHGVVFEIRGIDGYGARWSKDGSKFIGFLEPYMEDGHNKEWKH